MLAHIQIDFGHYITLVLGLGLGILTQWLAWRFKLPSILLLVAFGFGAGQFLGINIDDFLPSHQGESLLLSTVGIAASIYI